LFVSRTRLRSRPAVGAAAWPPTVPEANCQDSEAPPDGRQLAGARVPSFIENHRKLDYVGWFQI